MKIAYNKNLFSDRRKQQIDHHFSKSAKLYLERSKRAPWSFVRQRELLAVKSLLHPSPTAKVLEVGSGSGHYYTHLAMDFGAWINVEPNLEMCKAAINAGVETFNGDLHSFIDRHQGLKFDRVLVAGVFEFLTSAEEGRNICLKLKTILNSGGRIVVLSPNENLFGGAYLWWKRKSGCPTISMKCLFEIKSNLGRPKQTIKHLFSQTQVWLV